MKNEKNPQGDNSQFDFETFDETSDIVAKTDREGDKDEPILELIGLS